MKTRRIHPRASIIASVILAGGATAASLAWTGCSSPEGSESQGSALGQDDAKPSIVISHLYGAGGNGGSTLNADFVELFNNGSTPVTMTGWALQYASQAGTWATTAQGSPSLLKTATIAPGQYYLVAMKRSDGAVFDGPAVDDTGTLALSGSHGSVVLTSDATALTCAGTACAALADVVDVVGYGSGATVYEGTGPTGTDLTATTGAVRKGDTTDDGCTNSNTNSADFDIVTESATTPRNSSSPKHTCAGGTGGTAAAGMVISQVYGGGGNTNATLANDFVELFNPTSAPVSLAGASLQYGSATGDVGNPADGGTFAQLLSLPSVTVPAGGYFLVQAESSGAIGTALPTADANWFTNFSAANGKIGLVGSTVPVNCGNATDGACPLTDFIDLVGYGTANQAEGTPVAALSSTTAALRNGNGCVNTENNVNDFTVATPAPRNSASARSACGGGSTDAGTDSGVKDSGTDSGPDSGTDSGAMDSGTKDSGTGGGTDSGTGTDSGGGGGGTGTGSSTFVISQVFGDGAYMAGLPDADYVEIFNRSASAQSLNGMSLQYGSATGDFAVAFDGGDTSLIELPNVSVPAGGYFLVGLASGDAGTPLPMADLTGSANLSYANGKIALVNGTAALSSCGATGSLCPTTDFVDLVGYGTADQFEGAGPTTSVGSGAGFRNASGCTDTNDNAADFTAGTPAPRNSASAKNVCTGGGGGGGGGTDSGTGGGGGGGGGGGTADSGTSGGGGDDDDNGDDDSSSGSGGKGVSMVVSDPNSGGCSTSGGGKSGDREGALAFGAFAAAVIAFNRRKKSQG